MKHINQLIIIFFLGAFIFILPGCSAIAGIFKAGVWTGVLMVAFVIGLIIFIISRGSKK